MTRADSLYRPPMRFIGQRFTFSPTSCLRDSLVQKSRIDHLRPLKISSSKKMIQFTDFISPRIHGSKNHIPIPYKYFLRLHLTYKLHLSDIYSDRDGTSFGRLHFSKSHAIVRKCLCDVFLMQSFTLKIFTSLKKNLSSKASHVKRYHPQ